MERLTSTEHQDINLDDLYRASIDATYGDVRNTNVGLSEQAPHVRVHLTRLVIETDRDTSQQLFVLGTLHSGTPDELFLTQAACHSIFVSPDTPLNFPTLIVEERVRNPDSLTSDEAVFREEGEVAVVEKQFRSAGHERVISFGLSPEAWSALANSYDAVGVATYLQWRLGPQWSAIPDNQRPPLEQYFRHALGRYSTITGNLPATLSADTIRSLSGLGVGIFTDEEVTDLRRFAKWMRHETFAPYALRERKAFLSPMQYLSIIINKERDMALLRSTVQELQNGHDVVISSGDLHRVVALNAIESIQGVLDWHIARNDIALTA
jgi:hypothetical protein